MQKYGLTLPVLLFILVAGCSIPPSPVAATPIPNVHIQPGGASDQGQPAASGTLAQPYWTVQLSGAVNVTPLVSGDLVIAATADGAIHAVRAATGELAWEYTPAVKLWDASLTADDVLVCSGLEGGTVVCLAAETGRVLWTLDLGYEVQSPMALAGDRIYVPSTFVGGGLENNYEGRASLVVVDRLDGEILWSVETENYILRKPLVTEDLVIVGGLYLDDNGDGVNRIYAFRVEDGASVWTYESEDGLVRWIERSENVLMFVAYSETIRALDLQTGQDLWDYGPAYWIQFPVIRDEIVYFGTGDHFMQAVQTATGEVLWEQDINIDALNQVGRPHLVEDKLWFNSVTGEIYGFNAATGQEFLHLITGHTARVGGALFEKLYILGDPDGMLHAYVID